MNLCECCSLLDWYPIQGVFQHSHPVFLAQDLSQDTLLTIISYKNWKQHQTVDLQDKDEKSLVCDQGKKLVEKNSCSKVIDGNIGTKEKEKRVLTQCF